MKFIDFLQWTSWKDWLTTIIIIGYGVVMLRAYQVPDWEIVAFVGICIGFALTMWIIDYHRCKRCIEEAKREQDEQLDNDYSEHYDIRP